MVDLQSTAVTPLTSGTATGSATTGLNAVQVAISDLSQALQDIAHTVQTNATPVALADGGNSLTLTTTLGNITVSLASLGALEKVNLTQQLMNMIQTQRPLTLTLQPGAPQTLAVLLIPASPVTAQPNAPAPLTGQPMPVMPLRSGETLPAIVLPSALPPLPQAPQSVPTPTIIMIPSNTGAAPTVPLPISTLPASVNAPVTTSTAAVPATSPVNTSAAPPPLAPAVSPSLPATPAQTVTIVLPQSSATAVEPTTLPAVPTAPPTTSTPTPSPTSLLQAGSDLSLHVDAVIPQPASGAPTALPPLAPNQVAATVISTGSDGNLILKTGDTNLFVKAQVTAPVGTTVIVTVAAAKLAPPVTLPLPELGNFPALPQALATLAQNAPQVLQQIMNNVMPQPTPILPGALMFLFNAFKQGNVRSWLGDDATDNLLHLGKADLVASLSRDLSEAGQTAQDTVVGEWRSYPIPLYAQQQFQALTLHVHSDRDARRGPDEEKDAVPRKIRFLIDMRLSKLGAMQVDGFVQSKKLDMSLRSETILPEGLHNELRGSYIKAMGAVGYIGTLNFQVGRKHWMTMQQPAPPGIVT